MKRKNQQMKLTDIPLTQVRFGEVNYLYEAAVAFSRKRGDRAFFIKEPERLARTAEELKIKYRKHQAFVSLILDERDRLLAGEGELETIMELVIVNDSESKFLPELLSLRGNPDEGRERALRPSAEELAMQLIEAWHMLLVGYMDLATEDQDEAEGGVDFMIAKYRELLATTDFTDFAKIVQLIMSSENEGDAKVKLIEIYQNESAIFREIAALLLELAALIEDKSADLQSAIAAVSIFTQDEGIWDRCRRRVADVVSTDLGEDVTIYLTPQLMMPNALGVNYSSEKKMVLNVGVYFFELIEQVDAVQKRFDTVIEQTKLLSDTSRLRIIMLLQGGPMYLKELADNLGLSSATVSHHVQNMINHELLQINVGHNNRRVYYSLRRDRFLELGRLISELGKDIT